MRTAPLILPFALLWAALLESQAFSETLFVQPQKALLKASPQMNAATVSELSQGSPIEVQAREGLWIRGKSGAQEGWIHKLFAAPSKPTQNADLKAFGEDQSLAKTARRRSSSYTVAATTRGLTAGNRIREGRDPYPADWEAIERIEKSVISQEEIARFKAEGNLSP